MNDQPQNATAANDPPPASLGAAAPSEFLTLFLAEQRRLYYYIVTLLADPQDAEDLLQETVGILWKKFDEFKPGTNFFAWASQTAHYLVLNHRRRQKNHLIWLDHDVLEKLADVPAEDQELLNLRRSVLYGCLNKLSPKDRTLFERRYASTARGRELASELGRSADSVFRSLGRIRRTLIECVRRAMLRAEREGGGA